MSLSCIFSKTCLLKFYYLSSLPSKVGVTLMYTLFSPDPTCGFTLRMLLFLPNPSLFFSGRYTISAAHACFLDKYVGSLSPGKYADFVVLSTNSWEDFATGVNVDVEATYVGGSKAYSIKPEDQK